MIRDAALQEIYNKRMSIKSSETQKIFEGSETVSDIQSADSDVEYNEVIVKKRRVWFLWLSRSKVRIRWDLFIMFLATWNCFYVPFNVAFEADIFGKTPSAVMNWLIDILFMIDVVVNFRTAILDEKTGKEIYDGKIIALSYLRGKFWIDISIIRPLKTS
jgi:hypothetical protein